MNHTVNKIIACLSVLVIFSSFVLDSKVDPTGIWEYKAFTEQGHSGTFEIIKEQGQWSGKLHSEGNEYTMNNMTVEGQQMNFEVTTVDGYLCKVVGNIEGDEYSATLTVDYNDMSFEATRVKK